VLRKILGPSRDEVSGQLRILLNDELIYLYNSCIIVRIMKCRRLRQVKHSWEVGKKKCEQSLDGETFWKMATLKPEKAIGR
jgi:hypothetical protein